MSGHSPDLLRLLARAALLLLACAALRAAGGGPPAAHPLGIRPTLGTYGFYDTVTGSPFVPRGYTYIRMVPVSAPALTYPPIAGGTAVYVGLLAPGYYDVAQTAADLDGMQTFGCNVVRLFMNHVFAAGAADAPGQRLSGAYLNNLVNLLQLTRARGMYVILSFGYLPPTYYSIVQSQPAPADAEGFNLLLMHPGLNLAQATYINDVLDGLAARDADAASGLFSVELMNEPFYLATEKPFSIQSGTVTMSLPTAHSYVMDVSNPNNERQKLADDAATWWASDVITRVRAVHPGVKLAVSVFSPYLTGRSRVTGFATPGGVGYTGVVNYVGLPDVRQPVRLSIFNTIPVDYLDLHSYPVPIASQNYDFAADMRSSEVDLFAPAKPLITSEFAAYKYFGSPANPIYVSSTPPQAVAAAVGHVHDTAAVGFSGWIFFTWNQQADNLWYAQEAGYALADALSTNALPDPWNNGDLSVVSPVGPAVWTVGRQVGVHWRSNVASAGTQVRLELWNSAQKVADVGVDSNPQGDHVAQFIVPAVPGGSDYKVRAVSTQNTRIWDQNPGALQIRPLTAVPAGEWTRY